MRRTLKIAEEIIVSCKHQKANTSTRWHVLVYVPGTTANVGEDMVILCKSWTGKEGRKERK